MRLMPTTIMIVFFLCANAAAEETGAGEQSIFNGSIADAIWTVIAFAVFAIVTAKAAWKPLLSALKARQEHIQSQIETAQAARKQAQESLEKSKYEAAKIIQQSTEHAHQRAGEIEEKSRQEIELARKRSREDIERAERAAAEKLWQDAGEMIQTLGSEILGRVISSEDDKRLIDEAVRKIRPLQSETTK